MNDVALPVVAFYFVESLALQLSSGRTSRGLRKTNEWGHDIWRRAFLFSEHSFSVYDEKNISSSPCGSRNEIRAIPVLVACRLCARQAHS